MTSALQRSSAAVAMSAALASCMASPLATDQPRPTAPPEPASPAAETAPAPAISLAAPAPEILGAWETRSSLDTSGSQQIIRVYRFFPDATYDYRLSICRSSTDCTPQSSEAGYFQAAGGVLALLPQTEPSDGQRAYPYTVGRDPDVGDIQLHMALPDGQTDIFYFSP